MANATDTSSAAYPLQEHMDAAEHLARLVAGDDGEHFVLVFQAFASLVDEFVSGPDRELTEQARAVLLRSAALHVRARGAAGRRAAVAVAPTPGAESVFTDRVFLDNARKMIPDRERIIGGIRTSEFPDCVAIGSRDGWCCSGTLVASNVVVTAGHCRAGDCSARVLVGTDVREEDQAQVIEVEAAVGHPDYRPPNPTHDLAVLILAEDATVEPRAIAGKEDLDGAASVRLAGFGNTDVYSSGGYGQRRMVDVPLASNDAKYGGDPATEFVAGAPFLDRDSCNGDSGGPAYVQGLNGWVLAGATSRATASTYRPCGDGGIYTRVAVFDEWVRSVPGGHWGH